MRTYYLTLTLITFPLLGIFSCSEQPTNPNKDHNVLFKSYFSCKIDGVEFKPDMILAFRNPNNQPRNMVITGTDGFNAPMLQFVISESAVLFEPGMQVICDQSTFPSHYSSYRMDSIFHLTAYQNVEMKVVFSEINYENDGLAQARFTGTLSDSKGKIIKVTDGRFRVFFQS
ncbi:hypothetical protein GYB22_08360 [bacterium]|nr:hypothetical protein [bacterium]